MLRSKAVAIALAVIVLAAVLVAAFVVVDSSQTDREVLFQVSTLDDLSRGHYTGTVSLSELRSHGDIGLGTFDSLDGEMTVLDGVVYQFRSDGNMSAVTTGTTPFASVTFFDVDARWTVSGLNLTELGVSTLATANPGYFGVVTIHGHFSELKVRSVPKQSEPFPPLPQVIANQTVFNLTEVDGTLVGIYSPPLAGGIDAPGFHFHFISDDRKSGGHVLAAQIVLGEVCLDETRNLSLRLT